LATKTTLKDINSALDKIL